VYVSEKPFAVGWTDDIVAALNRVAAFLALDDFSQGGVGDDADLIVLAGNSIPTVSDGAFRLARERKLPLLITGGIGHATAYLMAALAVHPVYRALAGRDRTEADALKRIAVECWHLPADGVLTENASTNCGENAAFSKRLLAAHGLKPRRIVLVQDPLMQRRTDASFRRAWKGSVLPDICNWPVLVPRLEKTNEAVAYAQDLPAGLWPLDRFVSLILGEIPRLRDNAEGYGPKGRGFIVSVFIPTAVEAAYACLADVFASSPQAGRIRPAARPWSQR